MEDKKLHDPFETSFTDGIDHSLLSNGAYQGFHSATFVFFDIFLRSEQRMEAKRRFFIRSNDKTGLRTTFFSTFRCNVNM